jgi:hypothetical protein
VSRTTLAAIAGVLALSVVLEGQDLDTIVHQVDGEPVGDASEAIRTFPRLAGSKTQQQEFERLRNCRHLSHCRSG